MPLYPRRLARLPLLGSGLLLFTTAMTLPNVAAQAPPGRSLHVYFGTYTQKGSKGIYHSRLNLATGELSAPTVAAETPDPSFLAVDPAREHLYAANERTDGPNGSGWVSAFSLDRGTGALKFLNRQSSRGGAPCHLVVDRTGEVVLVANYGGGSVAALPIDDDGKLGEATAAIQHRGSGVNPRRQEGPHAHSINLDRANRFAFAADLGLDRVLVYRFDSESGSLTPHDPPFAAIAPGGGPRHFAFHPSGRYAYVNHEMTSSVTGFNYDARKGTLTPIETLSSLPEGGAAGNSTAEIQVHPSGRFLYCSNRGHNSIAIFRIDPETGRLTAAGHQPSGGRTPRNFAITPGGEFLLAANQDSGTVVVFRLNEETGQLAPTGHQVEVPMAVCVRFVAP